MAREQVVNLSPPPLELHLLDGQLSIHRSIGLEGGQGSWLHRNQRGPDGCDTPRGMHISRRRAAQRQFTEDDHVNMALVIPDVTVKTFLGQ